MASYCYGEPTCGQKAVYELGLSGVPVFNVNNNCSSGSSALMLARRLIQSGIEDCVMALGIIHNLMYNIFCILLPVSLSIGIEDIRMYVY